MTPKSCYLRRPTESLIASSDIGKAFIVEQNWIGQRRREMKISFFESYFCRCLVPKRLFVQTVPKKYFLMGQSRTFSVYFCPFHNTISIIQIEKSINGVHGIRTHGRRMVGGPESTELWQPPKSWQFDSLWLMLMLSKFLSDRYFSSTKALDKVVIDCYQQWSEWPKRRWIFYDCWLARARSSLFRLLH